MTEKEFKEILLDSLKTAYEGAVTYNNTCRERGETDPPPPPPPPNTRSAENMTFEVLGQGYITFGDWVKLNKDES